jgi:large subunit ribosomal protein L15
VFQSDLRPVPGSTHKKKRVGRGNSSGHGTYSGRGIKGQKSRTGPDLRIGFEGGQIPLVRALSRVRGFNNRFRVDFEPVNLERIGVAAEKGEVTPESLKAAGIVKSNKPIKILADGDLDAKLKVTAHRFSAAARSKIEAAGGSVVELMPVEKKEPKASKKAAAPSAPEAKAPEAAAPEAPAAARAESAPATTAEKAEEPAAEAPAPRRRRAAQPKADDASAEAEADGGDKED